MQSKKIKQVCCAIIIRNDKFLVAQRNPKDSFGGFWEFPGGSIKKEESKEKCLIREIQEEIGVEIEILKLLTTFEDEIPSLKINIFAFQCRIKSGIPRPIDCQRVLWAKIEELKTFNLAPADKKILVWLDKNYCNLIKID